MKYVIASLILAPFFVFAQDQVALPKAGFVPESPFYFFDKLGEAIQEFFTFNPQAKARLQITFAAERIAEIKIILETKGVEAKGLDVAQSRLQANIAKAANIVSNEKSKGRDVSALAQDLSDKFEAPKSALTQTFKDQKKILEAREDELKAKLRVAHRAGDTAQEEVLAQELGQVKAQKELLELKEEDIEDDLGVEEERIKEEMEAQHKAEKAIRKAEKEKQEVIDEAAEEDVVLATDAFVEFDNLILQAKSVLGAGNFEEARRLAKEAKISLEKIEKTIKELEKKQELKEEAEEAIQEVEEKKEKIKEEEERKLEKKGELEEKEFEISGSEFSFSPSSITVKSGQKVKIKFRNHGGAVHNLTIEGLGVGTKTISPDDDASVEFIAPAPGTYAFYCAVPGHRPSGMEGKLIVE